MTKRTRNGNPAIAIAYIRVSTTDQKLGQGAQRTQISEWARAAGVTISEWCIDAGVSGASDIADRPALGAALVALRKHNAGLFVVAKRDRIARDVGVAASVERAAKTCGALVVSAAGEGNGDSPADEFMRGVIDLASQYERALIRSRTKAALRAKLAKGECIGQVPYGFYREGDRLIPIASEQATIARSQCIIGSLRAVAKQRASEGRVSRTGKPFAASQVARMQAQGVQAQIAQMQVF